MTHGVHVDYTNWRGIRSRRLIYPIEKTMRFTATSFHPEVQWLFDARCQGELRTFALKDIHSWTPETDVSRSSNAETIKSEPLKTATSSGNQKP